MRIVVVIPVDDYDNPKEDCAEVKNNTFNDMNHLRATLNELLITESDDVEAQPQFLTTDEFMEEYNDDFISSNNTFISFVNVNNI